MRSPLRQRLFLIEFLPGHLRRPHSRRWESPESQPLSDKDRADARQAMRQGNDLFGIESVLDGPAPPVTGDRRCGVDEVSVHIEEESIAAEFDHRQLVWHTRDEAATLRGGKIVSCLPTF